jgi:hypothetical protein
MLVSRVLDKLASRPLALIIANLTITSLLLIRAF